MVGNCGGTGTVGRREHVAQNLKDGSNKVPLLKTFWSRKGKSSSGREGEMWLKSGTSRGDHHNVLCVLAEKICTLVNFSRLIFNIF